MVCLICDSHSEYIFSKKILSIHQGSYFQCSNCGFIHLAEPHWLNEAYRNPIVNSDIGLLHRNLFLSLFASRLIVNEFQINGHFLDFAGGYGVFVRLMRDAGFDFYREDQHCPNIFAQYFDVTEATTIIQDFELITAFEVFEHLENPHDQITKLFSRSDSILFSTELVPNITISALENWEYLSVEGGQHISFFTKMALEHLAKVNNCHLFTDGYGLHLFTRKKLKSDPFAKKSLIKRIIEKLTHKRRLIPTKLHSDHSWIKMQHVK